MPDNSSIDAQVRCVQREIEIRERLYPMRVRDKRMNPYVAEHELQTMRAVLKTLMEIAMAAPPKMSRGR